MPTTETAAVDGPPASPQGARGEETASTGSRWKLSNWPLRTKLAAVLIIPLVTALAFGGLRAISEVNRADELHRTVDQVDVAAHVTNVIQALQAERTLAVARIAGGVGDGRDLDAQIAETDAAVRDLRAAADQLDLPTLEAAERYDRGLDRLEALEPLRAAITNSAYPDLFAFNTYTSVLEALVQLGREVTTTASDRELLRLGTTLQALSEVKEFVTRENAALQIAAGRNEFPADLLERTQAAQASSRASLDIFMANATTAQQQLYTDTVTGADVDRRERLKTEAFVRAAEGNDLAIDVQRLTIDGASTSEKLRAVESALLDDLRAQAAALASDATRAAWVFFGLMLAALVAALALMLVIARALIKPLRTLRTSALETAYVRLPETVRRILADPNPIEASQGAIAPVPVHSREEIGEVARSFDVVHERAIRMAAEQALLRENVNGIFVNLSRRSQRLVERQLAVIDRLEAEEQDPDQLASLFELDHLSTRLRRNGESLLVLSGAGLSKSVPKPVPAADVIGAAVSEIEQYARVEVGSVPDVAVRGPAVHDLVHLLAELFDNATYFSEPETKISVRAVVTRRHALAIQITDRGVGMTEEQLAEANERLADPPDLDVSVTRRMGLYVVARLAQRHGIEVRLRENEDIEGGVIARVVVPTELLTSVTPGGLAPPPSPEELSHPSLPSLPPATGQTAQVPPAQRKPLEPKESSRPPAPVPSNRPAEPVPAKAQSNGELKPLDQPISLDDLVAGGSWAAGPFFSDDPEPEPPELATAPQASIGAGADGGPAEPQWPVESPDGDRADQSPDLEHTLALPKRQPRYVPVTPDRQQAPEPAGGDGSALEDDVPTRRLPIYQSVLSRWFSEENELEPVDTEPEQSAMDEPREQAPEDEVEGWRSVSDSGWEAAHALLEPKGEELTPAGLPKRVPNAYLVPGSVNRSDGDAFRDTTVGAPGQGAIARSAEAARNRMASFQRGYQSGRHALRETPAENESHGGSARPDVPGDRAADSAYNGAKE
ncbi:signal transduction histidine kinase [Prauserella shujinwangii]|uniref:histidine kinase n=1 Tax=Prauserella shujinwangii TaxID=1453103 RepID=A0A2T0M0Z6_9PSEU|nr:signal transduction histidine kinase [Prauserella shujinwangii]